MQCHVCRELVDVPHRIDADCFRTLIPEIERLRAENKKLDDRTGLVKVAFIDLEAERDILRKENDELNGTIDALEQSVDWYDEQADTLKVENAALKAKEKALVERVTQPSNREANLQAALEHAVEWMSEDGCDCGVDEPGSCGLCEAKAALSSKKQETLTTENPNGHRWAREIKEYPDGYVVVWCASCGVHRVEVPNWKEDPDCPHTTDKALGIGDPEL